MVINHSDILPVKGMDSVKDRNCGRLLRKDGVLQRVFLTSDITREQCLGNKTSQVRRKPHEMLPQRHFPFLYVCGGRMKSELFLNKIIKKKPKPLKGTH